MRITLLLLTLFLATSFCQAQDLGYVKSLIDTLCAPSFDGRGYVNNGDVRASVFLESEAMRLGLKPVNGSYTQSYVLAVNTFPGAMDVIINGNKLETGRDFIINPNSKGAVGTFDVLYFKPKWAEDRTKVFELAQKKGMKNTIVVFDLDGENAAFNSLIAEIPKNPLKCAAYIILKDEKLTWSVGRNEYETPILEVLKSAVPKKIKAVELNIENKFIQNYKTQNVSALIPGKTDTTVVFSAHFDHLGRMGAATYIPGASDNASGTAMLFDLAKHYLENQSHYTIQFIWFSGEEAGLLGSFNYVEKPMADLDKIKFLLNLDLMADAKKGVTVVNGKIYPDHFAKLSSLNAEMGLLQQVKARGEAANSDHYPFTEKDIPGFFIYTMGDYKHYHDIDDKPENLPMTNYEQVFQLITEFVKYGF
jgi:aminopeptidase YwaD